MGLLFYSPCHQTQPDQMHWREVSTLFIKTCTFQNFPWSPLVIYSLSQAVKEYFSMLTPRVLNQGSHAPRGQLEIGMYNSACHNA